MIDRAAIFREWFGLGPAAGRLIAALYEADGAVVRLNDLATARGQTVNGTNLSLKKVRAAMEPDAIRAQRLAGYWMSEEGFADCRRALADAERRGIAA